MRMALRTSPKSRYGASSSWSRGWPRASSWGQSQLSRGDGFWSHSWSISFLGEVSWTGTFSRSWTMLENRSYAWSDRLQWTPWTPRS
jgi:hypothetical protein